MVVLFHKSWCGCVQRPCIRQSQCERHWWRRQRRCVRFRRQPKCHEKNFLFQYIWSVGRFSEANDKSLFPNPFNIYTSVMLTRRRCCFSPLVCLHLANFGCALCFGLGVREQPKTTRIQYTFRRNNNVWLWMKTLSILNSRNMIPFQFFFFCPFSSAPSSSSSSTIYVIVVICNIFYVVRISHFDLEKINFRLARVFHLGWWVCLVIKVFNGIHWSAI